MPVNRIALNAAGICWGTCVKFASGNAGLYCLSKHRLQITHARHFLQVSNQTSKQNININKHKNKQNKNQQIWNDGGTGARPYDVGFWRAEPEDPYKRRYREGYEKKGNQFYSIGDIAERSHLPHPIGTTILVREKGLSTNCVQFLREPIGFEEIWNDRKSRARFGDCSVWRPIPPSPEYVALGYVVTPIHGGQPETDVVMCVHKSICDKAKIYQKEPLWTSRNTTATFGTFFFHHNTRQHNAIQYNTTLQNKTTQVRTQHNTTQSTTTQYNTTTISTQHQP